MYVLKIFLIIPFFMILNKLLVSFRKNLECKLRLNSMMTSIITRRDLLDFGMDYYLTLCKYIIIDKKISKEVYIQDITGREIVDIKFVDNDEKQVYVSCILKDTLESGDFENVTYSDVLDLLNFMIKDDVNKGIIFTNSYIEEDALNFIEDLNKNSKKYKMELIDGYEVIKFARKRNGKLGEGVRGYV